jgi:hypothetical protein
LFAAVLLLAASQPPMTIRYPFQGSNENRRFYSSKQKRE